MTAFSIIVPVYKVENYLRQCVDSLLSQDFNDFEVILVDDGSPDSCPAICDEYAQYNKRIKVVHKTNGGLSDARNAGIAVAEGRYITFVDSDDFWANTNVLSDIKKIIDTNNCPDVIVSDFIKYFDKGNRYIYPSHICDINYNGKAKIEILKYLFLCHADMKISACQKFVKNELLTRSSFEKGLLSEDIDWTLSLYPVIKTIAVNDRPYYCYRQQREGSITNKAAKRSFDAIIYIIEKWRTRIPELNISEEEKVIYLGYLAYQLSIAILLLNRLEPNERSQAIKKLKQLKSLFKEQLNFKTRKVAMCVRLFGINTTARILAIFSLLRLRVR